MIFSQIKEEGYASKLTEMCKQFPTAAPAVLPLVMAPSQDIVGGTEDEIYDYILGDSDQ